MNWKCVACEAPAQHRVTLIPTDPALRELVHLVVGTDAMACEVCAAHLDAIVAGDDKAVVNAVAERLMTMIPARTSE